MTLNSPPIEHFYGLGLDTTTAALTLAIGLPEGDRRYQSWHLDRDLSSQLQPLLRDFMAPQRWTDLAWIAALKGPGSFTGTRIGVVTARTLAQQLNLPLFGFSSLAIAAWIAARTTAQKEWSVAVSQAGQRGTVYGAIYRIRAAEDGLTVVSPDRLMPQSEWSERIESETGLHQVLAMDAQTPIDRQQLANAMLTLGWQAWKAGARPLWSEVLPYYG
ncbi:tRNA (adenosine(37)-N6)-threonylcarbamoyltransferase complex dimerization subunit type 1 TsaB [Altericista sp. CCNU0014]|uniref:tRNA (adenosine(37)-N6)-threonylcarbamoyltransferase complex dimerization subunit type 1 TsaB n=1 Tax=Altericista sp. CCNU0014 TaxID=3082949 RepID=UPI0038504C0A